MTTNNKTKAEIKEFNEDVFDALDDNSDGLVTKKDLLEALDARGILENDPRLGETQKNLKKHKPNDKLSLSDVTRILHQNATLTERALRGLLVIPNFDTFRDQIEEIYKNTIKDKGGAVADYIPELSKVNPEQYGISVCTVDGQRYNIGETNVRYPIESTCKPINYCIALDDNGEEKVHNHIGREQSGVGFNELTLNKEGLPHNPMINAGAIMSCSLVKPKESVEKRLRYIMDMWEGLSGEAKIGFDKATFESEKVTAYRNFALTYFMRENEAFPKDTDLLATLDLYLMACSIELTCEDQAIVAGTLANGGVCPTNGKRILRSETVKHCLSMMYSSGMYDFSGEFSFLIGLPAKSGVSGAIMLVIPGVMGITIWSPRLDEMGNSVRGLGFCKELVKRFNFHIYDGVSQEAAKTDPRLQANESKIRGVIAATNAASKGDLNEVVRLEAQGADLNEGDYDLRTPIHLAASEGQEHVIRYFISRGLNLSPRDRWGGRPLSDAIREGHSRVVSLLRDYGAKK